MIKIHLSEILGKKRWTQSYLAKQTGIRPNTINELYHEFAHKINFEHLDKICEVLECDVSEIIEYIPNKKPKTGKNLILEEHKNRKEKNN